MGLRMRCFCLVLTMMGAPQSSRAQQQNPPSIPTDLVQALLDRSPYDPGRQPRLFVAGAPARVSPSLTSLEGGTVMGGVEYDQTAVVVIGFTLPPNQVVLSVDRQLRARGWTPPPPPPDADRGGFVSTDYPSPFANTYCADSTRLILTSMPAPRGGTYLKITQIWNQQFSPCRLGARARGSFASNFEFPRLLPPPGMVSHGAGFGSDGESARTSASLKGPLKPVDLVSHYRAQLDAAGWKTRAPVATGEEAAISYVEFADSARAIWRGMMTALQIGPSDVEVEIRMVKPRER